MTHALAAAFVGLSVLAGLLALQQANASSRLTAALGVFELYREFDHTLMEHPELTVVAVREDAWEHLHRTLKSQGIEEVKRINFAAYLLGLLEQEYAIKQEYSYPLSESEVVFGSVLNNPLVRRYWNDPGLKHWYTPEFQKFAETLMVSDESSRGTRDE